ncbi:MAG: DNA-binding response regulator [Actinobacteria bacterium]|nr:DNA-binding response regulator [Actinomycetota bacterium]
MSAARVLVVDDDAAIRQTVADALRLAGHLATEARDGAAAIGLATREPFDLVILDVNMPHVDGFSVLEKLRQRKPELPIIMLTARDEREDVVRGLKLGADDYIRKPFGLEEFSLRVSAVLRRAGGVRPTSVVTCGDVQLNTESAQVTHAGVPVQLSPTEFRLLHHLMLNEGHVLSKDHLLASVWGIDFETQSSVVETYVSYLRRKLDRENHGHIVTVRGFGIKFEARS